MDTSFFHTKFPTTSRAEGAVSSANTGMLPFTGSSQLQQQQTSNYPRPPRATDDPSRHSTVSAAPVGGGRAWPGFETTRRAKLAARTARGRAAAHGRRKQPGPEQQREGRCTRYGALHPIRRGALPTDRVQHTQSQEQTRNLRDASLAAAPVGGGWAWPDNEPTRRAKLAARTARGRADAHGRVKQHGPQPQLSTQRSADTPRRTVAAIRDGDAGGGQPVA